MRDDIVNAIKLQVIVTASCFWLCTSFHVAGNPAGDVECKTSNMSYRRIVTIRERKEKTASRQQSHLSTFSVFHPGFFSIFCNYCGRISRFFFLVYFSSSFMLSSSFSSICLICSTAKQSLFKAIFSSLLFDAVSLCLSLSHRTIFLNCFQQSPIDKQLLSVREQYTACLDRL